MLNFSLLGETFFGSGALNVAGTDPGKTPGYLAMTAKIRRVAKTLTKNTGDTWTPAQVQETVWSWAKTLYELAEQRGTTAEELLRSGQLTDAAIASTPDFASLLTQDATVREILEAGGYGPALSAIEETVTRGPGRDPGATGRGRTGTGGARVTPALLRNVRRLDALRTQRAAATAEQRLAKTRAAAKAARTRQRGELYQTVDTPRPWAFSRLQRASRRRRSRRRPARSGKPPSRTASSGFNLDELLLVGVDTLEDKPVYTRAQVAFNAWCCGALHQTNARQHQAYAAASTWRRRRAGRAAHTKRVRTLDSSYICAYIPS